MKKITTSTANKINAVLYKGNIVVGFDLPASTLQMYAQTRLPMEIMNFE